MTKKIVITGGHLTPALAVIDQLQKRKDWQIFFIGRRYSAEGDSALSIESQVIPQRGIPFYSLVVGRIQRRITRWTLVSLLKIPIGFIQAFIYLLYLKPDAVLSFGGYLSSPVVFSAWLLQIPVLTHEQTTVKGLATKFNAFFAKIIAVSWPKSVEQFSKDKVVLTGNPIRKEILSIDENYWQSLGFEKGLPLIFITGGNQGGHMINKMVEKVLPVLVQKTNVFHQCGYLESFRDFEKLSELRNQLPAKLKKRYQVNKYLNASEMGTLLHKADLVISRSGANITTELAVLGKPCLLIPLSWIYKSEQDNNAEMLQKIGLAEILLQNKLTGESFLKLIDKMLSRLDFYQANAAVAKKMVKREAAKSLIKLIDGLVS